MADQQWWSRIFPEAECVTIEGADHEINALDAGLIAELMAGFITGTPIETPVERQLVAVLFTDLVDSTPAAAASRRCGLAFHPGAATRPPCNARFNATTAPSSNTPATAHSPPSHPEPEPSPQQSNSEAPHATLGLEGRTGIHSR